MTLEEMKGKVISEAEGKFNVAKEDLETIYDEFGIPISIVRNDGCTFIINLTDQYYISGSEEKDFSKYMADEYARIIRERIDDDNKDASEVLERIKSKIAPRTIEDVYKGKLFLISEYMIKKQEEMFCENIEDAIDIMMGLASAEERKKYKEVIRNKVYKKLIENAILTDDSDTYSEDTRKKIVDLIEGIDVSILIDEKKVEQNCPDLLTYREYIVRDIYSNKVCMSLEEFQKSISKGVSNELIPIINNIFIKSHVVAENMKNLCGEIKKEVDEVPAIDEE